MAKDYGKLFWWERNRELKQKGLTAEWNVPDGRLGQVIRQLRRRGVVASRRARVFLRLLVGVVIVGLIYYLGQPLLQVFSDGTRGALTEQLARLEAQDHGLNADRETILSSVNPESPGLRQVVSEDLLELLRSQDPSGEGLGDAVIFFGDLYYFGWRGSILRIAADEQSIERLQRPAGENHDRLHEFRGALYVLGDEGSILRIAPDADGPTEIQRAIGEAYDWPIEFGDALFLTGDGGSILRITTEGSSPETLRGPTGTAFRTERIFNNALYLFDENGGIVRIGANASVVENLGRPNEEQPKFIVEHNNALYVVGERGSIRRLTPGASEAETLQRATGEAFQWPYRTVDALFLTSQSGRILRLTSDSSSAEVLRPQSDETFQIGPNTQGGTFFTGSQGTILRLSDGSDEPELLQDATGEALNRATRAPDGSIIVASSSGRIIRMTSDQWEPETVLEPEGEGIADTGIFDTELILFGERGSIWRISEDGNGPQPLQFPTGDLYDRYVEFEEDTLYVLGASGSITRVTEGREEPVILRDPTGEAIAYTYAFQAAFYVFGEDGSMLRIHPETDELVVLRRQTGETLSRPFEVGDALYLFGDTGIISRVRANDMTAVRLRGRTGERFGPPIEFGDTLYFSGVDGSILISPPSRLSELESLPAQVVPEGTSPGAQEESDPLQAYIRDMIGRLDPVPPRLEELSIELAEINARRDAVAEIRAPLLGRLDDLNSGLWSLLTRQDPALPFGQFMATCRPENATPEQINACTEAFAQDQANLRDTWWDILARQVPPGLLLLFLLVTLGGLYRYNMRMAGFHHSRADLLELLAMGRDADAPLTKFDWEHLRLSAEALAADKVEFGATKANVGPGGVNFEIARNLRGGN